MGHTTFRLLVLTASVCLLPPAFTPAAAQEGCASAACHGKLAAGAHVHPPIESCETCHEAVATPHPQRGSKTFKLTQEPPALCGACHDLPGKKKVVHPPVADGACTVCHDPHSSAPPKLLVMPIDAFCQTCHDVTSAGFVHGPAGAGDCTACHVAHESDTASLLSKPGDELCLGCHLDIKSLTAKPHVHAALQGGCTSCHQPHAAAHARLLKEAGETLCLQCHGDLAEALQKAETIHAPARDGGACASCHSPHGSDHAKLLLEPEKDTCLGCHGSVVTPAMTVLHGPIREGRCTPCHDPHASRNPALLVKDYPSGDYMPYTPTAYGLCFTCHKRELLQYPETSFATGFRDGERNLHHLHVNRDKGRTCSMCHGMHGSSAPRLMAESVPFGKWNLPLKFVKTATGGGCTPGCHKPYAYDREVPGRKPSAPPAR